MTDLNRPSGGSGDDAWPRPPYADTGDPFARPAGQPAATQDGGDQRGDFTGDYTGDYTGDAWGGGQSWGTPSYGDPHAQQTVPPASGWPVPEQRGWQPFGAAKEPKARVALVGASLIAALIGGVLGTGATLVATGTYDVDGGRNPRARLGTGVTTPRDTSPDSVAAIAERVLPVVVSLDVAGVGGRGTGSGVIIHDDGYVVTNNHVVEGATKVSVTLANGNKVDATIVGTDPLTDLAVVKLAEAGALPVATLGRSNNLRVGEPVVAVGSPLGLRGTVTSGIISALNRRVEVGNGLVLADAIQTDAAINPGNSGGALVDRAGAIIGINSAIASLGGGLGGQGGNIGVGFAIPIDEARAVAEEIIRTGKATHPYLGVNGADITPQVASQFNLDVDEGALLTNVSPGTPAADAGLRVGDVVVRLGDAAISGFGDLVAEVRSNKIGETVTVEYIRDGERRTARVTLVARPS